MRACPSRRWRAAVRSRGRAEGANATGLAHEQRLLVARELPARPSKPGRPWLDDLDILDIVLIVIRTGLPWGAITTRSPSRHTCKRRYELWLKLGVLRRVLIVLEEDLEHRTGIDPFDPDLELPEDPAELDSWEWETVLLLRSPGAARILHPLQSSPPAQRDANCEHFTQA